jgi:glycosyltransferase involved in cell wall biosynthesis
MRILIINSEYPPIGGGAGNASSNLAREFVGLHQNVTVLTVHFNNLLRESVEGDVRVIRVKSLRRRLDQSDALEQIAFMLIGSTGTLSLIRKWRPDVILAFFGVPGGVPAWFAEKIYGIPYVVSLRGGDVPGFRPYDFAMYHRLIGPIVRQVWRNAGGVVANSNGLCSLAGNFEKNVEIKVVPNGVDITRYRPPNERKWDTPRMLWVGRLVYQKGLDVLFDSLGRLKEFPWDLTLVGDGPQREALEESTQEKNIADRIVFKGWLDKDRLIRYYNKSNLFVFPSRHEGMPNAVLEAMASGLPVIATQIAGNEELIHPGKTGLLVPSGDVDALEKALRDLLPDPIRREQMGLAARVRVTKHYTWTQVARQYLSLFETITG